VGGGAGAEERGEASETRPSANQDRVLIRSDVRRLVGSGGGWGRVAGAGARIMTLEAHDSLQ
jgi:hypothetical protein